MPRKNTGGNAARPKTLLAGQSQPAAQQSPKPLLLPRYDRIFKKIFGSKGNTDILRSLLSAILDMPPESLETITVEDPNLRQESGSADKCPVLDLKLTLSDGTGVDLELQVGSVSNMKKRIIFCTSKLVTEQLGAGNNYSMLHRVITVVITYFDLTGDPDAYHHRFFLYDKKHDNLFTNSLEIDILETGKLPKGEDGTPLWLWGKFFEAETEEEFNMLAEKNAEMGKAVTIIKRLSGSERERRIAEIEELARMDAEVMRMDAEANLRGAYNRGEEKGMDKGIEKGIEIGDAGGYERAKAEERAKKLESAVKLFKASVDSEVVAQSLGISVDELRKHSGDDVRQ
jgi:predicted transposase/invertase (TIGR01784 family)